MESHRSRRWKSGSMPPSFWLSSHTSEASPATGFQWNFTSVVLPLAVDQPEGVDAETLHGPIRPGNGSVRHDPHQHVGGLGRQRGEVPEGVVGGLGLRDLPVGLGLGGVDEVRELDAVLDEEDRHVVADQIPVALPGVEPHGESPDIPSSIRRTPGTGHGRESHEGRACRRRCRRGSGRRSIDSMDWVSWNVPCAAAPRAWTTRSGIRSWSKCMIFSRRWKSSRRVGPRSPTRRLLSVSSTGTPLAVVSTVTTLGPLWCDGLFRCARRHRWLPAIRGRGLWAILGTGHDLGLSVRGTDSDHGPAGKTGRRGHQSDTRSRQLANPATVRPHMQSSVE